MTAITTFYVAVELKWRADSGMPKVTHDVWAAIGVSDEATALAKFDRDQRQLYLRSAKAMSVLVVAKSYATCKAAIRKAGGAFPERHPIQATLGQDIVVGHRNEPPGERDEVIDLASNPAIKRAEMKHRARDRVRIH
jgi:hypothetical protein